jgi:hypothetical protein
VDRICAKKTFFEQEKEKTFEAKKCHLDFKAVDDDNNDERNRVRKFNIIINEI